MAGTPDTLIELVTIGDELVTGHTVDTNAAYLTSRLTDCGYTVGFISSVGDELERMEQVIRHALARAKVVITSGGLGPTEDDLTKRVITRIFKRNLVFHEEILSELQRRAAARGMVFSALNQNQALLPQAATLFPNKNGSAVGICLEEEGHTLIALPGVPRELQQIFEDEVLPFLHTSVPATRTYTVKIRTTGTGETHIAELLGGQLQIPNNLKLAYLPSYAGVDLRIVGRGDEPAELERQVEDLAGRIESKIHEFVLGRGNDGLETHVGSLLLQLKKTLAIAESCTGGMLGSLITSQPGSSAYFLGGAITYANETKVAHLKVEPLILEKFGAVSEECAKAMASGARETYKSDFALSITGVAGPDGGTDSKPVGTVWIGYADKSRTFARKFNFGTDRQIIRTRASYAALAILWKQLQATK